MHIRTGLNVRHADEQLRGTIALPHGLGKDVKVAVFAQGDKAQEAEEAGADLVGAEDLAKQIEEGFDDFDVAIATPDLMPVVGRLGRILGPRARCRTRRSARSRWTSRKAVEESKAGKVEYRTDRTAIVHLSIGKSSFDEQRLLENYAAVIEEIDPRQAVRGQGQVHPLDHAGLDDGAGHQGRSDAHARHRGGGAARGVASFQERPARDPRRLVSPG